MKNFSISQSFSTAWQMLRSNLLLILFFFIALLPCCFTERVDMDSSSLDDILRELPGLIMPILGISFICQIIQFFLMAGANNSALIVVKGGKADFNAYNISLGTYLKYVCANICADILIGIGFLFCFIPGIFLAVRLGFVGIIILDDPNCGFTDAFQRSWDMTRGNFWNLFAFGLACILVAIVGAACCCVGIFIAIPLVSLASIVIYMALKPEEDVIIEEETL